MQVSAIAERLEEVRLRIARACERGGRSPDGVTLVAVVKGFPPEVVRQGAAAGIRHFGENRVQEAQAKLPLLADLSPLPTWHMVGHLQTNKVKTALSLFDIIQSVDSLHLAETISKRVPSSVRVPILLEVNVGGDPAKYGFSPEELPAQAEDIRRLPGLEARGLMTVAPMAADPDELRPVFRRLRQLSRSLDLPELSMGMTDDFEVALEEGATIVRIGRAIFGERSQP
jgi:hypothetical protein